MHRVSAAGDYCGMRHRHGAAALAGLVLGVLTVLSLPAGPAAAHAVLVSTAPSAGAIVPAEPRAVTVTFSEPVRPVIGKIKVLAPDGRPAGEGMPISRGAVLTVPLRGGAGDGTYLVSYRVVSLDAHPVGGSFTFSVGAPSTPPTLVGTAGRVDPAVAVAMAAARWLGYAGLVLVAGPTVVLMLLWPRRLPRRRPSRLAGLGLGLVALGTVAEVVLQAPYGTGTGIFALSGADLRDAFDSRFGSVHVVRLGALAAIAILLRPVLAGRDGRADRVMLGILAAVALATWPVGGHAAASSVPTLTVLADVAHLAAMSVWLGGLVMLFGFLLPRASLRELRIILPVWSGWAMLAVAVLAIAGTAQALVEIATPQAFIGTTYGRLVIVKICLLAAVLGVAWYSRRTVERLAAGPVDPVPAGLGPADTGSPEPTGQPAQPVTDQAVTDQAVVDLPVDRVGGAAAPAGAVSTEPAAADPRPTGPNGSTVDLADREAPLRRRLRRAVLAETAGVAVVLAVAAALVQSTPARDAVAAPGGQRGPYVATLTSDLYLLDVEVDPARVGPNGVHLFAYTPDRKPLQVLEWHATVALPAKGIERLDTPLLVITESHSIGEVDLPAAGDWEFRFTLIVSEFEQRTVTATVPIR
jgi:putative copper export protein/methionine-rich copper-binding protein CopC